MTELVIRLDPESEERLAEAAAQEGLPLAEYVQNAVNALAQSASSDTRPSVGRQPAWQRLLAIGDAMPEADQERLPVDGAENLDHYLYGAPKRVE